MFHFVCALFYCGCVFSIYTTMQLSLASFLQNIIQKEITILRSFYSCIGRNTFKLKFYVHPILEDYGFHLPFTFMQIYIAPSKALVQEKLRDWNQKFGSWGVSCLELTGDNETYNMKYIQEADIILTTPEVSTLNR